MEAIFAFEDILSFLDFPHHSECSVYFLKWQILKNFLGKTECKFAVCIWQQCWPELFYSIYENTRWSISCKNLFFPLLETRAIYNKVCANNNITLQPPFPTVHPPLKTDTTTTTTIIPLRVTLYPLSSKHPSYLSSIPKS